MKTPRRGQQQRRFPSGPYNITWPWTFITMRWVYCPDGTDMDEEDGRNQTRRRSIFLFDEAHRRCQTQGGTFMYQEGPFLLTLGPVTRILFWGLGLVHLNVRNGEDSSSKDRYSNLR